MTSAALCAAGLGFLWLGWHRSGQNKRAQLTASRASVARRKAEEALGAVLLDRSDGAAIWEGTALQSSVGIASPLMRLREPSNPERIAEVLVRADEVEPLAAAIGTLFSEGTAFELSLSGPEDRRRRICGNVLGTRVMLTATDAHTLNEDRPRVEDELRGARKRIEALEESFAASPVLAWQRDGLGKLSWVNRRFLDTVDAPSNEAALDCQIELMPGDEAAKLKRIAELALMTGVPVTERHVVTIGGEKRTLEITETPSEEGTLGSAIDVSAQVAASDALVRQIEANKATLGQLQRGIAVFDKNNRLTFFNEAMAGFWAIDPDWLSKSPTLREVLNALREANRVPITKDFRAWRQSVEDAFEELTSSLEREWYLPGGQVYKAVIQPHPLGGTLCVFEDASTFHALKRDAATASAVYRTAFSRLGEGVAVFGLDGRCRLANEAMLSLWRLQPEDTNNAHVTEIARRCRELFDDESVWSRITAHVSAATDAREVWDEVLLRTDGSVLQMSTAPLPDGATLFAFREITDSYNRQRALTEQNEKLEEISRLKSQFLSSIHGASHELKIPLNTIVGFSEILAQEMYGDLNERQHEYIDGIYQASNQLRQLVGGIIDLAMLQADYFAFRVESIDVLKRLRSAVTFIERNSSENLIYRIECAEDIGSIPGDAPRFGEIVHTLLNALKAHAEPGETIEVGAVRRHGYVRLWIGAEQSPIPDTVRDIFLRDGSSDSMPELRRVALGITLVRQFIERQGGSISIEPNVGGTQEAVVYHLLTDGDAVRSAINREPGLITRSAAEQSESGPMNRQQAIPAQRRVDLRDDAATQDFGKRLAALLQPGDAIMLSGDLGAGKSTLARAAIKALIGEDEAVPSPTFTITQRYETATATIVHADLYRLGDPDELIEIGLEDDFATAITFVEWPGLLGEAMPDERIEITLDFAPGDGRVALLSGHGIRPAAILSALCDDRDALRLAFVALGGWSDAESQALDGDASRRRYFRLRRAGEGGILMDAPPLTDGSARAFEHVTRLLRQRALSAPEILHAAAEDGFLLLEDLGDDLYSRLCAASPEGERGWYETAVDLLHHLGVTSTANLPPYDVSTLLREAALLTDWWIPAAGGDATPDLRAEYLGLMQEATAAVAAERSALVLRDYHADNLLWLPEREGVARVGLLDYQDALLGHPAYDLVSLLEDARRDVAPELAAAMFERFLTTRQNLDRQAFRTAYDVLGAQRNAKIVGIFARLCLRDGKPRYLDLIPRVWTHLQRDLAAPELAALRGFFERHVPAPEPAILARIGRSVAA